MAVNEQIVTGRKFRKLVDEATKLWQRISFWTKASDVEFNDAKTAETKVGAIDGITDSLVSTSSRIAASAKAVNTLSNNLPQFIYDSAGRIIGYKTQAGADTVFPFSSVYYLGSGNSFNVSKFDGYENFTVDNFIIGTTSASIAINGTVVDGNVNSSSSTSLSKSYNAKTGILTISGQTKTFSIGDWGSSGTHRLIGNVSCVKPFAYLVIGDIQTNLN